MASSAPVLEIAAALPGLDEGALPNVPISLDLCPGDCAVVESQDSARTEALADLCSGLVPLRRGALRFMGYDWTELDRERAAALRGRIGRLHGRPVWIATLGTHVNVMLPQLHHRRDPEAAITRAAAEIGHCLGLPGLPTERPDQLADGDLLRAGYVRAFLGEPRLLLLETAITASYPELITPLLDLLSRALSRGAAALCFTRELPLWQAQRFPINHCLSLQDDGLKPVTHA